MRGGVYFIRGAGLIKIGVAVDFTSRVRDLQACSPVPLEIVKKTPGSYDQERSLHRVFRDHRKHGEWFDLPDGWEATADAVLRGEIPVPDSPWVERWKATDPEGRKAQRKAEREFAAGERLRETIRQNRPELARELGLL